MLFRSHLSNWPISLLPIDQPCKIDDLKFCHVQFCRIRNVASALCGTISSSPTHSSRLSATTATHLSWVYLILISPTYTKVLQFCFRLRARQSTHTFTKRFSVSRASSSSDWPHPEQTQHGKYAMASCISKQLFIAQIINPSQTASIPFTKVLIYPDGQYTASTRI